MIGVFVVGLVVGLIVGVAISGWDFGPPNDTDRACELIDMEVDTLAEIRSLPEVRRQW